MSTNPRSQSRISRRSRVRKKIRGSGSRPRLSVFRSAGHIYAQVIDDEKGVTLAAASTLSPDVKGQLNGLKKSEAARIVGKAVAGAAKEKGVTSVVFDRNGFLYHGG